MNQTSKNELREYLRQTTGSALKIAWPFLALSLLFAWLSITSIFKGSASFFDYILAFICSLFSVILLKSLLFANKSYQKKMDEFENSADYPEILNDFENSTSFADDEIRLGSKYIFGNESEKVLPYDNISSIFQYVHSTNYVEDSRELRAYSIDNSQITICKLPLRKEGEQAFFEIAQFMKRRNPSISISKYRK